MQHFFFFFDAKPYCLVLGLVHNIITLFISFFSQVVLTQVVGWWVEALCSVTIQVFLCQNRLFRVKNPREIQFRLEGEKKERKEKESW